MVKKFLVVAAMAALALTFVGTDVFAAGEVKVKKAIADSMTSDELAAYKQRLAERQAAGAFDNAAPGLGRTPADTCAAATPEISTLPYNPAADTTLGMTDNFDLPADTTNPTCAATTNCTGGGPAGSLPRGAIYTGTGTGPDRAYSIQVDLACTLTVNMDPTGAEDLALIVYQSACSSALTDCVCVDDVGGGGAVESVSLQAVPGNTYFIVVDGYSAGATPPGPSGPFQLSVTESTATGCRFVPVELQSFEVER